MDDTHYVDDFGNIIKRANLADWTEYDPWLYWEPRYNWIKCEDDLQEFDRVAWRDNVHSQTHYGESWHDGARFVIGEVRKLKDSKSGMLACMVVLHSEGMEAYETNIEIYRNVRQIFKNGLYRAPREDESDNWAKPQAPDWPRNAYPSSSEPVNRTSSTSGSGKHENKPKSRFLDGSKPTKPPRGTPPKPR